MHKKYLVMAVLMISTLVLYWPVLDHDFINYDDPAYVTGNSHVITGMTAENMRWAFTTTLMGNWNPITWFSHMADSEIYGMDPRGHHLTSIVLHSLNTGLLFLLLASLTGATGRSAFAAALFAFHPLRVESVAWVSERKDVLSAFFLMATLISYSSYVRKASVKRYLAVMLLFIAGLMSKPMLVTLPVVLLLIDFWPLGRLQSGRNDAGMVSDVPAVPASHKSSFTGPFTEKIPFFLISAIFSAIAIYAQSSAKAIKSGPDHPLMDRVSNALTAYVTYLGKTVWPHDLAVLYPLPDRVSLYGAAFALVLLLGVSFLFIKLSKRFPFLLFGWLWFMITLLPVIGLIQVGLQAMADRYTYIPSIGLSVLVVWGTAEMSRSRRYRPEIFAAAGVVVCLLLIGSTRVQLGYWKNSETLFSHAVSVTKRNYVAHANLGDTLDRQGRFSEAMLHYEEALRIKPDEAFIYSKMANNLDRAGRPEEAIRYYRKSLEVDPDSAHTHSDLGVLLIGQGNTSEAIRQFEQAVQLDPTLADAHYNLGLALEAKGDMQGAIYHYAEALQLNPSDPEIRKSLQQARAEEASRQRNEVKP